MSSASQTSEIAPSASQATASRKSIWVGRILSGLVVLFLIPDGIIKFIKPAPVVETSAHLGVGDPLFSHILFPTYLGVLLWLGLYLRDDRLRALIPLRS